MSNQKSGDSCLLFFLRFCIKWVFQGCFTLARSTEECFLHIDFSALIAGKNICPFDDLPLSFVCLLEEDFSFSPMELSVVKGNALADYRARNLTIFKSIRSALNLFNSIACMGL